MWYLGQKFLVLNRNDEWCLKGLTNLTSSERANIFRFLRWHFSLPVRVSFVADDTCPFSANKQLISKDKLEDTSETISRLFSARSKVTKVSIWFVIMVLQHSLVTDKWTVTTMTAGISDTVVLLLCLKLGAEKIEMHLFIIFALQD